MGKGKPLAPRLVDIDMGIGRQYGYRDPYRVQLLAKQGHVPSRRATRAGDLQGIRIDAGASQHDVACLLGVTQNVVSTWELQRRPMPDHVRSRWADVCAEAAAGRSRPLRINTTPATVEN